MRSPIRTTREGRHARPLTRIRSALDHAGPAGTGAVGESARQIAVQSHLDVWILDPDVAVPDPFGQGPEAGMIAGLLCHLSI